MFSDVNELSHCCAIYSIVGALFQLWVWIMITKQPFYIRGLEDVDNCKKSAFGSMVLFITIFFLSVCYLCLDSSRRRRYGQLDISEHSERSSLPPGMTDYEVNLELSERFASNPRNVHVPYPDNPGNAPFTDRSTQPLEEDSPVSTCISNAQIGDQLSDDPPQPPPDLLS